MNWPALEEPQRYAGLYVYDFGDWTAVGYTAEEIAILLESEEYGTGKAYRIQRATPDGQFELRGVSTERFHAEGGMLFYRASETPARADFDALCAIGGDSPPPCRAKVHLADRGPQTGPARFVTALIYPAEYEDEISHWLMDADYAGGDLAEGGISHVSNYYGEEKTILERQQLWSRSTIPARSAEDVFASVRRAVQR